MMKNMLWLACVMLWSTATVASSSSSSSSLYLYKDEDPGSVIEHTDKNNFKSDPAPKIVEFYSPYCGGCRAYKPEYVALSKKIATELPSVHVYSVSCIAHKDICLEFEIGSYPTLMAFPTTTGGTTSSTSKKRKLQAHGIKINDIADALHAAKVEGATTKSSKTKSTGSATTTTTTTTKYGKKGSDKTGTVITSNPTTTTTSGAKVHESVAKLDEIKEKMKKSRVLTEEAGETEDGEDKDSENEDGDGKEEEIAEDKDEEATEDKEGETAEDKDEEAAEDKEGEATEGENSEDNEVEKPPTEVRTAGVGTPTDNEEDENKDGETEQNEIANPPTEVRTASVGTPTEVRTAAVGTPTDNEEHDNKEGENSHIRGPIIRNVKTPLKPGRVPGAGAEKAAVKDRYMDKWRDVMEKQKLSAMKDRKRFQIMQQAAARRAAGVGRAAEGTLVSVGSVGSTEMMEANKPGTAEYDQRRKKMMERIEKANKRKNALSLALRKKQQQPVVVPTKLNLPFNIEPKKPGFIKKQIEKVPIVRRIYTMSPEEELILDASLSFVSGLKHGVYISTESLTAEKKTALDDWLRLVSVSLPPEWGLHALVDDLLANLDLICKSRDDLERILKKHPIARDRWSKSCDKTGKGGFSCGMWKLFHIVTVGVAEHRGGLNLIDSGMINENTRVFAPMDAADTIREYIAQFFGCKECREEFLASYDQCDYRRCDRLASESDYATPDDWKQLALWMWEMHNGVSVRINHEKFQKLQKRLNMKHLQDTQNIVIMPEKQDEVKSLWPTMESCVVCFSDDGKWNENTVFLYLERTYWDAPDAKFDRLLTLKKSETGASFFGSFLMILLIASSFVIVFLARHINARSFHSTLQRVPKSMSGVGNKLQDVVAGKVRND